MLTSASPPGPNVLELMSLKAAEFALDDRGFLRGLVFALYARIRPRAMQPYCHRAEHWTRIALAQTRAFGRRESIGELDDESIAEIILDVIARRRARERGDAPEGA